MAFITVADATFDTDDVVSVEVKGLSAIVVPSWLLCSAFLVILGFVWLSVFGAVIAIVLSFFLQPLFWTAGKRWRVEVLLKNGRNLRIGKLDVQTAIDTKSEIVKHLRT
jgi:hypothetical protein